MQLFTFNTQLAKFSSCNSWLKQKQSAGNRVCLVTSFCPALDLQADRAVKMILLLEDEAAKKTGVNVRLLREPLMVKSSNGSILPA